MDAATIKGVIDRLTARGFTAARADPADARRLLVDLTPAGMALYDRAVPIARSSLKRRSKRSMNANVRRSPLCCGASLNVRARRGNPDVDD